MAQIPAAFFHRNRPLTHVHLCVCNGTTGGVISQPNDALDQWPQGLTVRRHL